MGYCDDADEIAQVGEKAVGFRQRFRVNRQRVAGDCGFAQRTGQGVRIAEAAWQLVRAEKKVAQRNPGIAAEDMGAELVPA